MAVCSVGAGGCVPHELTVANNNKTEANNLVFDPYEQLGGVLSICQSSPLPYYLLWIQLMNPTHSLESAAGMQREIIQ